MKSIYRLTMNDAGEWGQKKSAFKGSKN